MQIVIDIPDEQIEKSLVESKYIHENEGEKGSVNIVLLYTNKKLEFVDISRKTDFYSLTDKYTVLPKGHGRLIDVKELRQDIIAHKYSIDFCKEHNIDQSINVGMLNILLADATTIIETDTESEQWA